MDGVGRGEGNREDTSVDCFVLETRGPEIDDFDATLRGLLE